MLDLHFWPTPNGKKVTILLEELGLDYNLVPCNIGRGDQFKHEFLKINPNHRMPVLVDHNPKGGGACPSQRQPWAETSCPRRTASCASSGRRSTARPLELTVAGAACWPSTSMIRHQPAREPYSK